MASEQTELLSSLKRNIDFFKALASDNKLIKEDIDKIFNITYVEPEKIEKRSINFFVNEERSISCKKKDKLIEVIGKNQIGKTTSILYMANMLGYNFYDENNMEFLKDEQVIDRGQNIFESLIDGMESKLDIVINDKKLTINFEKGMVNIEYNHGDTVEKDSYILDTQREAFRNLLNQYINVYFISKGRDFITQVLLDILNDMKYVSSKILDKADLIISDIRIKNRDLFEKISFKNGIDIIARRSQLKEELKGVELNYNSCNKKYRGVLLLQDNLRRILNDIILVESYECFKHKYDIYQLNKKIEKLNSRKGILDKYELDYKETEKRLKEINKLIEDIRNDIKDDVHFSEKLDDLISDTIRGLNLESSYFKNRENFEMIIDAIKTKNIELLIDIDSIFDHKAKKAIEEIYEIVDKHDSDIILPDELGGSMAELKRIVGETKIEFLDNSLILIKCNELIILLKEKDIRDNDSLQTLLTNMSDSLDKIRDYESQKEELESIKDSEYSETDGELLKTTIKEIENSRGDIKDIELKIDNCDPEEINKIDELIRLISTIDENPEDMLFSDEIEDLLITKRREIEENIGIIKKEYQDALKLRNSIVIEIKELDNYIEDSETKQVLDRLDNIRDYVAKMKLINSLFEKHKVILSGNKEDETYSFLVDEDIMPYINMLINNIFKEKCTNLYILEEEKYNIKKVTGFDYIKKDFGYNGNKINIANISGGTGSVLTVLTLASANKQTKMGLVLLIDEFNDVVGDLRKIAIEKLYNIEDIAFTFLVKPEAGSELSFESIKLGD